MKTTRTRAEIGQEIAQTYKEYKRLNAGSPAFKNVSKKLLSLDRELQEAQK